MTCPEYFSNSLISLCVSPGAFVRPENGLFFSSKLLASINRPTIYIEKKKSGRLLPAVKALTVEDYTGDES